MSEEKEIETFITGLALTDEFFKMEKKWDPLLNALIDHCNKIITSPGIYSFTLQIKQIK